MLCFFRGGEETKRRYDGSTGYDESLGLKYEFFVTVASEMGPKLLPKSQEIRRFQEEEGGEEQVVPGEAEEEESGVEEEGGGGRELVVEGAAAAKRC